ncbi:helix-turn-helix transcriptional regulator [Streptomyces bacillaris]|uniref:helix-turn-helix transcriptional regulator n=1 Tax=Streptomyces bacillaris TaxID=68179 RepID=UPI00345FFDEB
MPCWTTSCLRRACAPNCASRPGLTQKDVADAVGVQRLAVVRWELGQSHPRRPHREAYAHLLQRLAERFPHAAEPRKRSADTGSDEGVG